MKPYKQASIPANAIEIRVRGSREGNGALSFKRIVNKEAFPAIFEFLHRYNEIPRNRKGSNDRS